MRVRSFGSKGEEKASDEDVEIEAITSGSNLCKSF